MGGRAGCGLSPELYLSDAFIRTLNSPSRARVDCQNTHDSLRTVLFICVYYEYNISKRILTPHAMR